MPRRTACLLLILGAACAPVHARAQEPDRLLRQPTLSDRHVAFAHGGDLWVADREGGVARRLTATAAVDADPHFSPDGRWIAFTSDRAGGDDVYVVSVDGGQPTRLTWHPSSASARGWTPDGRRVLFASSRGTAPVPHQRLWTVPVEGGGPSERIPAPWGYSGSFSPDGDRIVVDRMTRADSEWRGYRGGQNTPLVILDLGDLGEVRLPNEGRTTDVQPVWHGDRIYFLSDREDLIDNVWSYDPASGQVARVTSFDRDVTSLGAGPDGLVITEDGWIHTVDPATGGTRRIDVTIRGDFPWARARWEDVAGQISSASLSPTGKRVLMEARGEVFTVPVEHGDPRNLTRTSGTADRMAVWSPDGASVAWFSDDGGGYALKIGPQDGLGDVRTIDIGESAMAWSPAWSPDGARIAFVDDRARLRVVDVESGRVRTADIDGTPQGRGTMRPVWSPDSRWLAYAKSFPNMLHRVVVWSVDSGEATAVTDAMADAAWPAWDRDGRHLWFLASTDVALGSGWANTSSMQADPTYGAYLAVLREEDTAPFPLRSDEEPVAAEEDESVDTRGSDEDGDEVEVRIDFERLDRRIVALPMPVRTYGTLVAGPEGTVFIGERVENQPGLTLHRFTLEEREATPFAEGAGSPSVSADGTKILYRANGAWTVADAGKPNAEGAPTLRPELRMWLDPAVEWAQIFDEAWRQERDFFYDPGHHGADWDAVYAEYRPLMDHVRHRTDLTWLLDRVNGELAVGHSFVFGGDYPDTDTSRVGLLGVDLEPDRGRWRIARIYTAESWNPDLEAPLDQPGMRVTEGDYLLAVNGEEITADDDPFRALDGTAERQTVLHVNDAPTMDGAWTETVEPIRSENGLRQRAWVEDNRRRVDELSDGRLAYVWVPNTATAGVVSFNRYFFSQQDRHGAVIDERYNGGGLLDDYMVDLMTRDLRAAITNEAPDGAPYRLPAGILGPKVLVINERAGSGGDYFPWVFRHQEAGPLVGMRTWGGLVASCVHYPLIDGGAVTAPCSAVFEPGRGWIAENEGVPPDIQVWNDARAVAEGRDPQLERAVQEALRLLQEEGGRPDVTPPPFSTPARPGG